MASAYFRFYEELNDFLPPSQRKRDLFQEFQPGTPVKHLIETFGVPHTEVEMILVNGQSVGLDYGVAAGDRVSVYPMFEALDISPLVRIRSKPLRDPRFLADAHLGKLARYLRLLGFDTLFDNVVDDRILAALAGDQGRILLTRDRALLMHRRVTHGCYVRNRPPGEQLSGLVRRLDLYRNLRPFTRCMLCNGLLQDVEKAEVADDLPPKTREHFDRFWRCEGCRQVYWKGGHYERLRDLVRSLEEEGE